MPTHIEEQYALSPSRGFAAWGLGFAVQGSGFRVQGSGFRVQGSGFRVQGLGRRIDSHMSSKEKLFHRNVQRFRGRLVFKAHRPLYHSTLVLRVIQNEEEERTRQV